MIFAQMTDAAILEHIKNLQQPVSHSAVIAAFAIFVILTQLWLNRKQAGDKRFLMQEFVTASKNNARVVEANTQAFVKLHDAIEALQEKERQLTAESRDMARLLATHPCLILSTKYREQLLALINRQSGDMNHDANVARDADVTV